MLTHEIPIMPDCGDRKAIRRMLVELPVNRRLEWLQWCCRQVSKHDVTTYIEKNSGSVEEIWSDWMMLCYGSRLTIRASGDRLHDMIKGRA